jgi:hypothetical protein
MIHMRWKCERHLNDANPLVAATWSKPLNNFDHVRNLPVFFASATASAGASAPQTVLALAK